MPFTPQSSNCIIPKNIKNILLCNHNVITQLRKHIDSIFYKPYSGSDLTKGPNNALYSLNNIPNHMSHFAVHSLRRNCCSDFLCLPPHWCFRRVTLENAPHFGSVWHFLMSPVPLWVLARIRGQDVAFFSVHRIGRMRSISWLMRF